MSLKRSPLKRTSSLKPGGPLRRSPFKARTVVPPTRVPGLRSDPVASGGDPRPRRSTGISARVRRQVHARSKERCERCGRSVLFGGGEVHHRRPRQMGGSRRADTNQPANLVMLCDFCHHDIESHREDAYQDGWLVHAGVDPATVPWKSAV